MADRSPAISFHVAALAWWVLTMLVVTVSAVAWAVEGAGDLGIATGIYAGLLGGVYVAAIAQIVIVPVTALIWMATAVLIAAVRFRRRRRVRRHAAKVASAMEIVR